MPKSQDLMMQEPLAKLGQAAFRPSTACQAQTKATVFQI